MKRIVLIGLFFCGFVFSNAVWARSYRSSTPTFSYDLGVSTGTYNDFAYTEFQLGLNWYLTDYVAWRNAVFTRFGDQINSATGLDTSARFFYNTPRDEMGFGVGIFGGPGYRFANKENSGVFGEAGVVVRAGGFAIGGGAKSIYYSSPGKDSTGKEFSKNDTVVFLILALGGAF